MSFSTAREFAQQLDTHDRLAAIRNEFVIHDPNLIYLDGNSLGLLPKAAQAKARQVVEEQWGVDLIRGWNKGWWDSPARVGDKIGQLIGAAAGQVLVNDTVSLNLFKLAAAALTLQPSKTRIITDTFNFPSDLYILQGIRQTFGGRHEIISIGASDNDITPDLAALETAIDENTALVTLSHVTFKSGYLYDMQRITELAHKKGALVLWDLSHSVGALPIHLDACNADLAIGCTYKYLNGGPGAPAFLYVNKSIQEKLSSPIWGWWGQNDPFDFSLNYQPARGAERFLVGTQPILSLLTMEAALEPTLQAGMDSIREKSILMTGYASFLTESWLAPFGFSLGSPPDPAKRGSHISIRHADGYRINRALIEEMNVIPDFREPDNIRLGFAPLYTSFTDVWEGFERIKRVMEEKRHEKYSKQKLTVT
ncbi:MAG TPA: kynureninase [Anaerolineales bacterium]|nr:kynureninase [Anaerolineales bacterium]HMV97586.1 kynureninase [Anaerolineales bacterium]HMX20172.1 kynureninase [Anaerolineales bacterium]HNC89898.1 kynureninase [Anaerolineales bacterium]